MDRHRRGQAQAGAIESYVNDRSDSHLPRVLALQSTIASHRPVQLHGPRPAASHGTSMLPGSSSQGTRHDSLPALTLATSRTASSIPSSIGARALENQQRILEEGPDGVLTVPPLSGRRILECPFNLAFLCPLTFSNEDDWMRHSLQHFIKDGRKIEPPLVNKCCFCDREFFSSTRFQSWGERMRHVCLHHCLGHRLAHARPDFALFKYLFDHRLISDGDYRDLKGNSRGRSQRVGYPTPPTSPNSPEVPVYQEITSGRRRDRRDRRPGDR